MDVKPLIITRSRWSKDKGSKRGSRRADTLHSREEETQHFVKSITPNPAPERRSCSGETGASEP